MLVIGGPLAICAPVLTSVQESLTCLPMFVCCVGVLCLCVASINQVERLVCGNPNLDFEALERNSKYEGGFSVATPAVQWLWQVREGRWRWWFRRSRV